MGRVGITEARRRLTDLVAAAERGQSVTITRRGKEVARIAPPASKPLMRFPNLAAFRASIKIKGRSLTDELLVMRGQERF